MKANLKALQNDTEGVSPVVATLMLVLVAAASAVGLSIFMGDFQDGATEDVGVPDGTQKLSIAGSSTVYEFSLVAVPEFEKYMAQRGTPVQVDLEKGGSGAGRAAVGQCLIDIGSSSSPVKDSDFESYPDCDRDGAKDFGAELQVFKVATDGVVFATLSSNNHCEGVPKLLLDQAYELYHNNTDNMGGTVDATVDGYLGAPTAGLDANGDGVITWDEIPDSDTTTSPTCDKNGGGADVVQIFDRKDPGGTSEIANEKLFGGDGKQIEDLGFTLPDSNQGDGNQGVLDAVEGDANANDALFFTSFGYALSNGVTVAQFGHDTAIAPSSSNIKDETYDATRPILYITAGEPSSLAQLYLDFVMNSHRNQLFAEAADFEHIY